MDNRYLGWRPLVDSMRAACAAHGILVNLKPKNGCLAVELPTRAPLELHALAEEVERISDRTCQVCGAQPAMEILTGKRG